MKHSKPTAQHCVIGLNVKNTSNFSLKCSYSKTKSEVLIWGKIILDGDQVPDEDEEAMMKLMGFSKFDTTKVWLSIGFVTVGIMMMMLFNDNFAGNSNQMETWNEDNVNCRNTNDYTSCNGNFSNCKLIQEKLLGSNLLPLHQCCFVLPMECVDLYSSVGRALQHWWRGHGLESHWNPHFFGGGWAEWRGLICNKSNCYYSSEDNPHIIL